MILTPSRSHDPGDVVAAPDGRLVIADRGLARLSDDARIVDAKTCHRSCRPIRSLSRNCDASTLTTQCRRCPHWPHAGKDQHHAATRDRKRLYIKVLPNDEVGLRALITELEPHGRLLFDVDQPTIGALPAAAAHAKGSLAA